MRMVPLFVLAVAGCAPAVVRGPEASPAELSRLERASQQRPSDIATRIRLGAAYRDAGRFTEARVVLKAVTEDAPNEAGAHLLLGLTLEDLNDWTGARAAYERYIALGNSADAKRAMERRLKYVQRKELESSVKRLAELERAGVASAQSPEPRTLAVFPFLYQGRDANLRPLSRALAEMLVTDLSHTDRLRVLERMQVQLLLDELQLGQSAYADPSTAARGGRMLRAARVIQGSIAGDASRLELGAFVVRLDQQAPRTPVSDRDPLERLFDLEKRLALALYQSMGVQLTAAERERVGQRPTENIQALLAFGLGLEAEDRGDYAAAAREYARAVSLDPDFDMAEVRATDAAAIGEAEQMTVAVLVEQVAKSGDIPPPPTTVPATAGPTPGSSSASAGVSFAPITGFPIDPLRGLLPDPFHRDSGAEVLGTEGVATRTLLRILFIRPSN